MVELCAAIRKAGAEAEYAVTDVSRRGDVFGLIEHAINKFGWIDVLVNNAADTKFGVLSDGDQTHGTSKSIQISKARFMVSPL